MEILFRGVKPSNVEYEGHCSNCNTRAKFKRGEATEVQADYHGPGYLWVKCPECEQKIISKFVKYVKPRSDDCYGMM